MSSVMMIDKYLHPVTVGFDAVSVHWSSVRVLYRAWVQLSPGPLQAANCLSLLPSLGWEMSCSLLGLG